MAEVESATPKTKLGLQLIDECRWLRAMSVGLSTAIRDLEVLEPKEPGRAKETIGHNAAKLRTLKKCLEKFTAELEELAYTDGV